jgi:RNA polymerase sigma factor (sigma-70 family)
MRRRETVGVMTDPIQHLDDMEFLARRFEENRGHLRAVAYRMLGSLSEADDAVQEAWIRLARADTGEVDNLAGWLTTVTARVCLNMLRSRTTRREDPLDVFVPEPIISDEDGADPEHEALLADSVGLALLVVLELLTPAERLAFVLHDMFAMSFDEIAPLVDRTPAAARQLASRARRRVQGQSPVPDTDVSEQRRVVTAFQAAARGGDFDALVRLLDPDVVLRIDYGSSGGGIDKVIRGARTVASRAVMFAQFALTEREVLVNGLPGVVNMEDGRPTALLVCTVVDGRIADIDIIADPEQLARMELVFLEG